MTVPGGGVGGSIGTPQQPMQREIEASAWTMVNRAALGIVPDTLEIPFTQLGGQVWKYQTDAGRPTLMPMGNVRTTQGEEPAVDESWKPHFADLVGKLPPKVKEEFLKDQGKPFEARSPNFTQLENTLMMTAKGLSWLAGAQKPVDPESPTMDRILQNKAMPRRALKGAVKNSNNILGGANAYLNKVGSNHPNHDSLRFFADQGSQLQSDLNSLLEVMQDPNSPPPTSEELTNLSDQAETLLNEFQQYSQGNDLLIMSPMLESMAAVASALSLTPASPSLFLGLKMATMGLFSSDSLSGLFGSELKAIIQALQSGQGAALLKKVGMAKLQMLMMSLLGSIGGAATLAALLSEFGIGRFPAQNKGEELAGRRLGSELIMQMIASSGIMKLIYAEIAKVCGGDAKAEAILSDNMELVSMLLMALTDAQGEPENAGRMLENLKPYLEGKVEKSASFLEGAMESGDLEGENAKGVGIALLQAKMALAKNDMKGLLASGNSALELVDSSPELLKEDLDEFKEFATLVRQTCTESVEERTTSLLRSA